MRNTRLAIAATTLAAMAGLASAAPSAPFVPRFDEFGDGVDPQPATVLAETSCTIDIDIRGAIATGVVRERVEYPAPPTSTADPDPDPELGARWNFALPADAVVTGVTLRADGGAARAALSVPADAEVEAADPNVLGVDPLIVTAIDGGVAFELAPIAAGHRAEIATTWSALVHLDDGKLALAWPARAVGGPLASCRVSITASAGPGATITALNIDGRSSLQAVSGAEGRRGVVDGTLAAARDRGSFTLGDHDATIAAQLGFARQAPVVWTATEALGGGRTSEVVAIVAPPPATPLAVGRALFVIDRSRSMDLIGAPAIAATVRAIATALPAGTAIDAIAFDRTAARVLGDWQPIDAHRVAAIEAAVTSHATVNGSELAGALALASTVVADGDARPTMLIAITDGMLASDSADALIHALARAPVAVHAIVLDPGATTASGADDLHALVAAYGGSYTELDARTLAGTASLAGGAGALDHADDWLHPAWVGVAYDDGAVAIHGDVRAGTGAIRTGIRRGALGRGVLRARERTAVRVTSEAIAEPNGAVAALALASSTSADFAMAASRDPATAAEAARADAIARRPFVDGVHAFAVPTSVGRLAHERARMIAAGGPYSRIVAAASIPHARRARVPTVVVGTAVSRGTPLPRSTLARMFQLELQPAAYACYQRALGRHPALGGEVAITMQIARGEVMRASATSLGDADFDRCVVDAAYALQPPLPDPEIDTDEIVVARYPLTFALHAAQPYVVLGDADSSAPLDIEAIERSTQRPAPAKVEVNSAQPLGGLGH